MYLLLIRALAVLAFTATFGWKDHATFQDLDSVTLNENIHYYNNVIQYYSKTYWVSQNLCYATKNIISRGTLWHTFPQRQFCLPKIQEMRSGKTFSLHTASISQILKPSRQGLISILDIDILRAA